MKTIKVEEELIRLSASSIITYLQCPREFYYKYILRMPEPPSKHLLKGSIVHKVAELFYGKTYREDMEVYILELFEYVWKDYKEKWSLLKFTDEETKVEYEDCIHILKTYVASVERVIIGLIKAGKAQGKRHAWSSIKPKLKEVWYEDKELGLCGYVDREHTDFDGDVVLGDYKTSSHYGIGLTRNYDIQMDIYVLLYYRKHGKMPDKTSIIFMRYGHEITERVTPYRLKCALDTLKHVRENTMSRDIKDYPCSNHKLCNWSSFFDKKTGLHEVEEKERQAAALKQFNKAKEKKNGKKEKNN